MLRKTTAMAAMATFVAVPMAGAVPVYELVPDASFYSASPGDRVDVGITFRETLESGDTSVFSNDKNLENFTFDIQPDPAAGAVNPGFTDVSRDFTTYTDPSTGDEVTVFTGFASPYRFLGIDAAEFFPDDTDGGGNVVALAVSASPTEVSPGVNEVYLGYFKIDVGTNPETEFTVPATSALFEFGSPFAGGVVLDEGDIAPAVFTVVIPEPTTALAGLGAAGLMLMRRRR